MDGWTFGMQSWQRPTLPRPYDRSTIGADRLNDRVRDGNGCGPVALVTSKIYVVSDDRRVCVCKESVEAICEAEEIKPHGRLVRLG